MLKGYYSLNCSRERLYLFYTIALFLFAGIAEIGGGYLIWLWLREGKPFYWGIFGGVALALYGVIATFQTFSWCFSGVVCTTPITIPLIEGYCFFSLKKNV